LTDHVAVTNHGKGIGSANLANFVSCFSDHAAARILSTGALQYELGDTGEQHMETMTPQELCDELADELLDVCNYAAFIAIKVLALQKKFDNAVPSGT
jgi:NTP pyrophosphatase (non-canonical NTP hydrolase)